MIIRDGDETKELSGTLWQMRCEYSVGKNLPADYNTLWSDVRDETVVTGDIFLVVGLAPEPMNNQFSLKNYSNRVFIVWHNGEEYYIRETCILCGAFSQVVSNET